MSALVDYTDRGVSILFGDAAGAVVLERDDDPDRGSIYQSMHADGSSWECLYIPQRPQELRENDATANIPLGKLRMHGREVYKFAVPKLIEIIDEALKTTGLSPADVSQFVCHQSNARIIESAIAKLGLSPEKVHMNIEHYGNSSAGSVGLCLDELWRDGKIKKGDIVLFVGIGGGLTWAVNVWRV
jgi:3-oxoacyl-[acyl-carrier-protein] synthase-3